MKGCLLCANLLIALLHDDPRYDFFEISQNSVNVGQHHFVQMQAIRDHRLDNPKRLNNVKIYGGKSHRQHP